MKFTFAKKISYAVLALILALATFSCENNVSAVDSTGTGFAIGIGGYFFPDATYIAGAKKSYVYKDDGTACNGFLTTVYLNGWEDVPFLSLDDIGNVLSLVNCRGSEVGYDIGDDVYMYRYYSSSATPPWPSEWNSDRLYFDPQTQTVYSDDFVRVISPTNEVNNGFGGDSVGANATPTENCPKIEFSPDTDQIMGKERTTVNLGYYGLKMFVIGGKLYVPVQALSVVLLETVNLVFNGTDYYFNLDPKDDYHASHKAFESGRSPSPVRSRLMAEYNYRVLCLTFDKNYCLKNQRAQIGKDNINLFNDSIFAAGLGFDLLSTDTETYDKALIRFLLNYIDDGHTGYKEPSVYQPISSVDYYRRAYAGSLFGPRNSKLDATCDALKKSRAAAGGSANDWWYVSENGKDMLGVLSFDTFETPDDFSPYKFFVNAFNGLKNDYPEIKNVVIDLSCNGGGSINQCMATLCFLGDNVCLPQKNHLDNSVTRFRYLVTDADGNSLKKDGYHFYVLTSGFSFSCGNYFPAICKYQFNIPIVGQRSGGGGGVVKQTQTADGAVYQTSASREMCAIDSNGNYVCIDHGVPVDLEIPYEDFYSDGGQGGSNPITYWNLYNRLKAAYPNNF
ncbi:MAG: hypothetical protein IK094_00535 [Treponema sp.]|nr:hypothetical protein [Treponema sp.]